MSKYNSNIFNEFPSFSKDDWKRLAANDLKDKDFEKLIWRTEDGIDLDPFFTKDDLPNVAISGRTRYYASPTVHEWWKYLQQIPSGDPKNLNKKILYGLNNGAEGVLINMDLGSYDNISPLLKDVMPAYCEISLGSQKSGLKSLNSYFQYLSEKKVNVDLISGCLFEDPLSDWTLLEGIDLEKACHEIKHKMEITEGASGFSVFTISSEVYKNSGATHVQELALTLSATIQYINDLVAMGISPESIMNKVRFSIAIGNNYFFEIAKLKSLRLLVEKIFSHYGVRATKIDIHAETAWWTKSVVEPHVNILRNTTEAMAAILGGCNSLTILPFELTATENEDFTNRVSRNISNILREESYFDKVLNPVSGAYFIDSLISNMMDASWKMVQEIEALGGFVEAFEKGYVKEIVRKSYDEKMDSILKVKEKIIGVNIFKREEVINGLDQATKKGWFEFDRASAIIEDQMKIERNSKMDIESH